MKLQTEKIEAQKEIFKPLMEKPLETVEWFDDRYYKLEVAKDFKIPDKFNPNWVNYRDDGIDLYLPSVTTIMGVEPKKWLATWRGNVGNREADLKLKEGQDRGSYIHHLCSKLAIGKDIYLRNERNNFPKWETIEAVGKINEEVFVTFEQIIMNQVARFDRLLDILKPKILDIEKNIYNIENDIFYGGTIDYIWEIETGDYQISTKKGEHIEGGVYVVDLKTGENCDSNPLTQTIAYTKALRQDIKGNIIIHTNSDNKTGIEGIKLFIAETKDLENNWNQFVRDFGTFKFFNKNDKPKLFEIPYHLKRKEI